MVSAAGRTWTCNGERPLTRRAYRLPITPLLHNAPNFSLLSTKEKYPLFGALSISNSCLPDLLMWGERVGFEPTFYLVRLVLTNHYASIVNLTYLSHMRRLMVSMRFCYRRRFNLYARLSELPQRCWHCYVSSVLRCFPITLDFIYCCYLSRV